MDIIKEIVMILLMVGVLGTLFNLFAGAELEGYFSEKVVFVIIGILYVLEIVGCVYMFKWDRESAEERQRTAYVIHIFVFIFNPIRIFHFIHIFFINFFINNIFIHSTFNFCCYFSS